MRLRFHSKFEKQLRKLSVERQVAVKERLLLFEQKPFIATLNNHALKGKYEGYRSINITGDIRAIFIVLDKNLVEFVYIGSHSQLYN